MIPVLTSDSDETTSKIVEIAAILAAGLLRLSSRKSSRDLPIQGDSPLDCNGSIERHVAVEIGVSRP